MSILKKVLNFLFREDVTRLIFDFLTDVFNVVPSHFYLKAR